MMFFEEIEDKKTNHSLWTELFRPTELSGYIGNEGLKDNVSEFIEQNDIPHLLFHGKAGTGKTTLAKLIVKNIKCDYMLINASDERGIDDIRDKVKTFASTMGFNGLKIIILDEADYLTPQAQATLRNVMETFSAHCRFILTCNYLEKVIDPLQSRCQVYAIMPPSKKEVAIRINDILQQLRVEFDMQDLVKLINKGYPDIRRVINSVQQYSSKGKLKVTDDVLADSDVSEKIVKILSSNITARNKVLEIRKLIADNGLHDFSDIYTYLYKNIDKYSNGKDELVILQIAEGTHRDSMVIDKEIPLMATIVNILTVI